MILEPPSVGNRSGQRGVGLIEVLIAVLVLAIGLLGIAAMQATALKNSQSSLERSQAVIHTYAMLDAMRANRDPARNGAYDMGMTCAAPPPPPPVNGNPAPPTLGLNDKTAWIQSLKTGMGSSACGQVVCVPVAASLARDCTVTVQWNDERGTGGGENYQVVTESRI